MNYRLAKILDGEDLGPAGTKVIDINTPEPISRIVIRFKTTKSKHGMDAPAPANITKIELVDGSQVLHSLDGYENQALAMYSRKVPTMTHGQHMSGSSEEDAYAIDFGRHLWDKELAFLPTKFNNPQLKITWNEDVADTGVTANECEVWGYFFDQKAISPIGFLQALEHYAYTPGASGSYEHIVLPTDFPIRQLLVRAFYSGYEAWYQIAEARLDEDNLKRTIFDINDLEEYYRMMKSVWTPVEEPIVGVMISTGQTFYTALGDYWGEVLVCSHEFAQAWYCATPAARGGKINIRDTNNSEFSGVVRGYLPWSTFQFPMGVMDDIDDWFDPKGLTQLRLRLRAYTGAANGAVKVVLEQLRKY